MARSVCPLDCPDACTLEVTVDADHGKVTRVEGTRENAITQDFICAKVRALPRWYYGPDRVETPLGRKGPKGSGRFEPLSWDAALDRVAEAFTDIRERYGGEAIVPLSYGGSNGFLSQDTTDLRLFSRLGTRRLARTVCAAATGAASKGLYGNFPGAVFDDYVHARLIVVWGTNPHATGIHILPYIYEAQKRGAKLVVVDPRATKLAQRADLHVAPRPGTDLPLALALIRILDREGGADTGFLERHTRGWESLRTRAAEWTVARAAEVCGISEGTVRTLAAWYREASPAVVRCGWGLERNRNGASAVAAVLALPAVAGKFGVRGGGYTLSNSGAWSFDPAQAVDADPWTTPVLNMNKVGAALTGEHGGPVHGLFVYNCNPLMTLPHQNAMRRGLAREDLFTVVFDSYLTDTARWADVVLPATQFLERREVRRGYGSMMLQEAQPVVDPVGESRTNHEVFLDLCDRLGLSREGDARTETEVRDRLMRTAPDGERLIRELEETGAAVPACGSHPVQFVDVFPRTADGKVDLFPAALDAEAPEGLYAYQSGGPLKDYPLALISPASTKTVSSSLGHYLTHTAPVTLHPQDAEDRGLEVGAKVRVFNRLGEVTTRLAVSSRLRAGVAELVKGLWSHNTLNGDTATALAPDSLTDCGGGACFNDARVEVEAAPE